MEVRRVRRRKLTLSHATDAPVMTYARTGTHKRMRILRITCPTMSTLLAPPVGFARKSTKQANKSPRGPDRDVFTAGWAGEHASRLLGTFAMSTHDETRGRFLIPRWKMVLPFGREDSKKLRDWILLFCLRLRVFIHF